MDTSKFEAIKNKARKMIHEDAKKDAHIIKERQADRNNPKYFEEQPNDVYSQITSIGGKSNAQTYVNESYDDSEDRLGSAIESSTETLMNKMKYNQEQTNSFSVPQHMPENVNRKLPKEILESFAKNYTDQSVFDPNRSIIDRMGISTEDPIKKQQKINETVVKKTQSNIDYELVKSIVENAVKKYVSALGKKMLTENKSVGNLDEINAIQITDKKIAIVTKNGNLFEGKLNFIKNIKEG